MANSPQIRAFASELITGFLQDPLLREGLLPAAVERYSGTFDAATGQSRDEQTTISNAQTRAVIVPATPAFDAQFGDISLGQDARRFVIVECPQPMQNGDILTLDGVTFRLDSVVNPLRAGAVYLGIGKKS